MKKFSQYYIVGLQQDNLVKFPVNGKSIFVNGSKYHFFTTEPNGDNTVVWNEETGMRVGTIGMFINNRPKYFTTEWIDKEIEKALKWCFIDGIPEVKKD